MSDDIEVTHDQETSDSMTAIVNMVNASQREGLLVEAIWSYGQARANMQNDEEACSFALNEWDI